MSKLLIASLALATASATSAASQDQIGETCSGSETVRIGDQAPKTLPFSVSFSADLAKRRYCYGQCGPGQSFAIADAAADPIQLANLRGEQTRLTTFDRRRHVLTDHQIFDSPVGRIVRDATASCKPSAFTEPAGSPAKAG